MSTLTTRLSPTENLVMRLVGLLIFVAPNTGSNWLADIHLRTAEKIAETKKESSVAA